MKISFGCPDFFLRTNVDSRTGRNRKVNIHKANGPAAQRSMQIALRLRMLCVTAPGESACAGVFNGHSGNHRGLCCASPKSYNRPRSGTYNMFADASSPPVAP